MNKEEIIQKLFNGEMKLYQIDKFTKDATEALEIRREFIAQKTNTDLSYIGSYNIDMNTAMKKILKIL